MVMVDLPASERPSSVNSAICSTPECIFSGNFLKEVVTTRIVNLRGRVTNVRTSENVFFDNNAFSLPPYLKAVSTV